MMKEEGCGRVGLRNMRPPFYLAIWPISGGGGHAGTNDEVTILGVAESRAVGRKISRSMSQHWYSCRTGYKYSVLARKAPAHYLG